MVYDVLNECWVITISINRMSALLCVFVVQCFAFAGPSSISEVRTSETTLIRFESQLDYFSKSSPFNWVLAAIIKSISE